MSKGKFIAFEGCDGSGKTTAAREVSRRLASEGYDVLYTREPGGIGIAEQIRRVILDPENTEMDARTEALLYAASRRQHLVQKVLPALERGTTVLSDRFVISSLVYQGWARGIGIQEVWAINRFAIEGYFPDRVIYLDVDPLVGLERIRKNRASRDRLDMEEVSFHQKVHEGYQKVNAMFADKIDSFDASRDAESVARDITAYLRTIL